MIFRFTKHFTAEFKKLLKKYHHAEDDFDNFVSDFDKNHKTAKTIKANIYKVRIKNSDKAKGKSAGFAHITTLSKAKRCIF
jgi:hypothetical protein